MAYKKEKLYRKPIISNYYNQSKVMKTIELISSVESLNKLSETKLSASAAFSLGKFLKAITPIVETYHKVRGEKVQEYGTPMVDEKGVVVTDDKGNQRYSFSDKGSTELNENGKKFVAEMTELENNEVDVKIPEIKVSDLGSSLIEPKFLLQLSWLIKE